MGAQGRESSFIKIGCLGWSYGKSRMARDQREMSSKVGMKECELCGEPRKGRPTYPH